MGKTSSGKLYTEEVGIILASCDGRGQGGGALLTFCVNGRGACAARLRRRPYMGETGRACAAKALTIAAPMHMTDVRRIIR